MNKILSLLFLLFVFCKACLAGTDGDVLKFKGAEILIPYKYQIIKDKNSVDPSRVCVMVNKKPYKIVACFRAGEEFSKTYSNTAFMDRDPETSFKKLPHGTLTYTHNFRGKYIKKTTIGIFDVYEIDDVCSDTSSSYNERLGFKVGCYIAVIDSQQGVSFSILSNYVIDYENYEEKKAQLDYKKQLKWIHSIIRSIKILKGVLIKKSTKEKIDFKPSFDCAKSRTTVEKTICADEYLSQLDVSLSESYDNLLHYSVDKDKPHADQRAWLKQRNACKTATCIQTAYEKRITKVCTQYPISGNSEPLCSDEVLYEIDNIYSLDRGK